MNSAGGIRVSVLLLLSCMFMQMRACTARHLGIPSFSFKDQQPLKNRESAEITTSEVLHDGESLFSNKVTEPDQDDSSTGNVAILSPRSNHIIPRAIECEASSRRQLVGEIEPPADKSRDNASVVDDKDVNAVKIDVGEDIVVMDYAQPHRKPPIHNEKP